MNENENAYENEISTPSDVIFRNKIISLVPEGLDPVIFWYSAAQDAIRSQEKERERVKKALEERKRAEDTLDSFTSRLIERTAEQKSRIPFDITNLINMAKNGDIWLNVSLTISESDKGKE